MSFQSTFWNKFSPQQCRRHYVAPDSFVLTSHTMAVLHLIYVRLLFRLVVNHIFSVREIFINTNLLQQTHKFQYGALGFWGEYNNLDIPCLSETPLS